MANFNQKLSLYTDTYNTDKYTSINYLAAGKLAAAEELTTTVVQLYGNWSDRFPLYLSTKGRKGGTKMIKSPDALFTIPIMGKPKKSSSIAKTIYAATDKIGAGKAEFYIYMVDKWLKKGDIVETYKKNKLKIQEQDREEGGYYRYIAQVVGADSLNYLTNDEISPGRKLAVMYQGAGLVNSRGRESRSQAPARMQNQCAFLRNSYNWKGNIENKVMAIDLPTMSGTTTLWQQWELFQLELHQMEETENYLWYSEWNRSPEGIVMDTDPDTGEKMPFGSGLLEQIPNQSTYGQLTVEKIKRVVRDVMYNSAADKVREITLYTGRGGQEQFDLAMKSDLVGMGYQYQQSTKQISGTPNSHDLVYGSYFGTFKHVDGHTVSIKYLPLLDLGARAEAAPKHPLSGLPITSYDMYFVDESVIDGMPNIQYVQEEGRQEIKKFIYGLNAKDQNIISSDADASSVQMGRSVGIHMFNPINSFKLICNLS